MLTLEHARRAVMLGLVAVSGTAAAQGTPGQDGTTPSTDGTDTTTPTTPAPPPTDGTETTSPEATSPEATSPEASPVTNGTDGTNGEPMPEPIEPAPAPPPEPMTEPAPAQEPVTYTEPVTYEEEETTLERYGIGVALSGGVEGFTDDSARDFTNDGGSWGVRVMIGTRFPVGFEASYIGSAQSIDALGLDNDAILVGNGLDGKIRVNFLDANIQPFAFAGLGWRHYNLTNEDFNTSAINDSDDVLEVPLGVGVATKWRGFMFDARGEYRYTADEDLMPSLNDIGDDASMHRWGVNANVGFAF